MKRRSVATPGRAAPGRDSTTLGVMSRRGGSAAATALLGLQRTIGNESVQRFLDDGGPGRPLETSDRRAMETAVGVPLDDVRVHTDALASTAADSMNAAAFASGSDIAFAAGSYAPATARGRALLAHEIVHVAQTIRAGGTGGVSTPTAMATPAEREAEAIGALVGHGVDGPFPVSAVTAAIQAAPREWFHGGAVGVGPSRPGGHLHDLGEGFYLTDTEAVANEYASIRAGDEPARGRTTSATFDPAQLGKVLDLTASAAWRKYMTTSTYPGGPTPESLISGQHEGYSHFFEVFVAQERLRLADYDVIIGPEYVRGGVQMCVRTPRARTLAQSLMQPVVTGPKPFTPSEIVKHVMDQRGFTSTAPRVTATKTGTRTTRGRTIPQIDPKGIGGALGTGFETHAAIQVIDANGKVVASERGAYLGGGQAHAGPGLHAEEQAADAIESRMGGRKAPGGTLLVGVDQDVCAERCIPRLRALAKRLGLRQIEAYGPTRPSTANPAKKDVSTKTAARTFAMGSRPGKTRPSTTHRLLYGETLPAEPAAPSGGAPGAAPGRGAASGTIPPRGPATAARPTGQALLGSRAQPGVTNAVGAAALMLHAAQFQSIQNFEHAKAQRELQTRAAAIEKLREDGRWVVVFAIIDAPRQVDILASVFSEQSQLRNFKGLIVHSGATQEEASTPPPTYLAVAGPQRRTDVVEMARFPPYVYDPQDPWLPRLAVEGTWRSRDTSRARMEIWLGARGIELAVWDLMADERWDVQEVTRDETTGRVDARLRKPSTSTVVHVFITVGERDDVLREYWESVDAAGRKQTGDAVWLKVRR